MKWLQIYQEGSCPLSEQRWVFVNCSPIELSKSRQGKQLILYLAEPLKVYYTSFQTIQSKMQVPTTSKKRATNHIRQR